MPRLPRWEMRILVVLPVLFALVALAASTVAIEMLRAAIGRIDLSPSQSLAIQKVQIVVAGVGTLVAAGLGFAIARGIVRPLRGMVQNLRARLDPEGRVPVRGAVSELSELTNAFNSMLLSFDKFVTDSHILEEMPFGLLVVDGEGRVTRSNAEARRLLRIAEGLEGRLVTEVAGPHLSAALTAGMRRVRASDSVVPEPPVTVMDAIGPNVDVTLQVSLLPTGAPDDVLVTLRDLGQVSRIRSQIRRVDELAAMGAHVASLAHEMSGSLMAVQTLLDLLNPAKEGEQEIMRKLQAEMDRAGRLMEEIRAFGQESLRERAACQIAELLGEIVWVCQTRFAEKGIAVEQRIADDLPAIVGDADRLRQALTNVVTNAFEATPERGAIRVTADWEGREIVVRIANTGSYIAPEDSRKIFDLFYTTKKRGSGFGLALARRTITDHGGDIDVTSAEDAGTEFVMRLPVAEPGA